MATYGEDIFHLLENRPFGRRELEGLIERLAFINFWHRLLVVGVAAEERDSLEMHNYQSARKGNEPSTNLTYFNQAAEYTVPRSPASLTVR